MSTREITLYDPDGDELHVTVDGWHPVEVEFADPWGGGVLSVGPREYEHRFGLRPGWLDKAAADYKKSESVEVLPTFAEEAARYEQWFCDTAEQIVAVAELTAGPPAGDLVAALQEMNLRLWEQLKEEGGGGR